MPLEGHLASGRGVRRPGKGQSPLKPKHSGDIVGPYCTTQHNAAENETYVQVQTDSAADGIGWMRLPALKQV